MKKQFLKDAVGWGVGLWVIGYVLGFIFYMFVPQNLIGWAIMPIGIALTWWVLTKKVKGTEISYFVKLGVVWTVIAIIFDYFFLVQLLKPADGYYKFDVYLYYIVTLSLPVVVGWRKIGNNVSK